MPGPAFFTISLRSVRTPAAARCATVNRSRKYTSGPVPPRTAVMSLATSVSEPGTWTNCAWMLGFALFHVSTIALSVSESGGVCEVQKLTVTGFGAPQPARIRTLAAATSDKNLFFM